MSISPLDPLLVGIFIGGASRRMGQTKGLLVVPRPGRNDAPRAEAIASERNDRSAPGRARSDDDEEGETIVERTVRVVRLAFPNASICIVGHRTEFDHLAIERLPDARENTGPLGGLVSLLRAAEERGLTRVLALGSDFPYLNEDLLVRIATESPESPIVAPFLDDRFQPLVARYSVATLPVFEAALQSGNFGLQQRLSALGADALSLEEGDPRALTDWDTPEDMLEGARR